MSLGTVSHYACGDPVVIEGVLPTPVFSSRDSGWEDLMVERYRSPMVSVVAQPLDYRIRVHLSEPVEMYQQRDGKRHVGILTTGMVTVTPPGTPKAWGRKDDAESLVVRFPAQFLDLVAIDAVNYVRREVIDVFGTADVEVAQIGYALLSELEEKGFASHVLCQSLLMSLAVHLLCRYSSQPTTPKPVVGTLAPGKVRKTLEFIDANLDDSLTLQRITDAAGMSPYHFARLFKRATGLAPHQYVIQRRLERAKHMLRRTTSPIAEIALAVGCANQSHFSALFRRATGMTPLAYRKRA